MRTQLAYDIMDKVKRLYYNVEYHNIECINNFIDTILGSNIRDILLPIGNGIEEDIFKVALIRNPNNTIKDMMSYLTEWSYDIEELKETLDILYTQLPNDPMSVKILSEELGFKNIKNIDYDNNNVSPLVKYTNKPSKTYGLIKFIDY